MILKIALSLILLAAVTSLEIHDRFIPEPIFTKNDKSGHHFRQRNQNFDFYNEFWNGLENMRPRHNDPLSNFRHENPKWLCDGYWCSPRLSNKQRFLYQNPETDETKITNGYFPSRGQSFQENLNGLAQRNRNPNLNFEYGLKESEPFILRPGRSKNPAVERNRNTDETIDIESQGSLRHFSDIFQVLPLKPQLSVANPTYIEITESPNISEEGILNERNYEISGYPVHVHSVETFDNDEKFLGHSEGRFNFIPVRKYGKTYVTLELNGQNSFNEKGQTLIEKLLGPNFLKNIFTDRNGIVRPRRFPILPILTGQSHFPDINTENFGQTNSEEEVELIQPIPETEMQHQDNNDRERVRSHSVKYWVNKKIKIRK